MSIALVTGAGGYIGGRLVPMLVGEGWDVRAIVREPAPRLGVAETICDLAGDPGPALDEACQGVDTVIHLAGESEVVAARDPAWALSSTVVATERIRSAAARAEVKRVVYLSTVHVYGAQIVAGATLTEDLCPQPRTAYAIARLASEHLVASSPGYELVVLRLTNSVGAPDDPHVDRWSLVANDLCRQGAVSGALTLRSSGMQWRDFVPLADVCRGICRAALVDGNVLPHGTYNLASGTPTTVRELARMIQDTFEIETGERPVLNAPEPGAERPDPYYVSTDRATRHGLVAGSPLAQAVQDTARFCLEHREDLA